MIATGFSGFVIMAGATYAAYNGVNIQDVVYAAVGGLTLLSGSEFAFFYLDYIKYTRMLKRSKMYKQIFSSSMK